MKVAYLIVNERPGSGLLNSQVVGLLKEFSLLSEIEITLIAIWQPWVYLKYKNELRDLERELDVFKIRLISIPFGLPSRYIDKSSVLLSLSMKYSSVLIGRYLKNFDVVHCRSYYASYIASLHKESNAFKLIFDMRSLFPEENIVTGLWKVDSKIFNVWKKLEKNIVDQSDSIVVINKPMLDHMQKSYGSHSYECIPIGYSAKELKKDYLARNSIRSRLNIDNKIVILYSGSIAINFWNDINVYAKYFKYLNSLNKDLFFLILTRDPHEPLARCLDLNGISNFMIKDVPSSEMSNWLSTGDFGIQVMDVMADGATRFGVKVVEYLAMGMPVITNSNVGGVADLVTDYDLGIVIDDFEKDNNFEKLISSSDEYSSRCQNFSKRSFEFNNLARQYLDLYSNITNITVRLKD